MMANRGPEMTATTFPARALRTIPVVVTVMLPVRILVDNIHVVKASPKAIHGATIVAMVDISFHIKTIPKGTAAPPTIIPRIVKIQVRLMLTALRMQQNLL